MRLARLGLIAAAVVLLPGCNGSRVVDPGTRVISGVVQYPQGAPVYRALVSTESGAGTFTDSQGTFHLVVPAGRPVRVSARDGYDGKAYAVTRSGSIVIGGGQDCTGHVVVLDSETPI